MKATHLSQLVASAVGVLALAGCAGRMAVPIDRGDAHAIRSVWEEASSALCAGDFDTYRRLWAEGPEVELLHPDAPQRIVGSGAILENYERLIAAGLRCSYNTTRFDLQIAPSGDIAWVSAEGVLSFTAPEQTEQRAWYTLVFARRVGSWRLVHAHASAVNEGEDSMSAPQSTHELRAGRETDQVNGMVSAADTAAVRAVYARWFGALEDRDVRRGLEALAPDAELVTPTGESLVGHAAIQNALVPFFAAHQEAIQWQLEIVSLSPDRADVRVREVTRVWPCAGGDGMELKGWHSGTLRRIGSQWLIVRDVGTLDGPPTQIRGGPDSRC